jgi:hypothetical protein
MPFAEYAAYYGRRRTDLRPEHELPALGDVVTVVLTSGETLDALCLGFDYHHSNIDPERPVANTGYGDFVVSGDPVPNVIPLATIQDIHATEGPPVAGATLDSLTAAGVIPMRTGLVFEKSFGGQQTLPAGDIVGFEVKSHTGRNVGMLVGLIADLALTAGAVAYAQSDGFYLERRQRR